MFGVTDVYFVAGYYGLMDVKVGHVKRLTYKCIALTNGKKIWCDVILKTVGVRGSYAVDKMAGLKDLVGFWVNGDPLFPLINNGLFVQASNFGGFSIGPGAAGMTETVLWFVDFPQDFEYIRSMLPVHNKQNNKIHGNALYVYSAEHATSTGMITGQIPGLGLALGVNGNLKHTKMGIAHPPHKFLTECQAEWDMYCEMCSANPFAKEVPKPDYPYTFASIQEFVRLSNEFK